MKKLILPLMLLLGMTSNAVLAQVEATMKEEMRAMSEGNFNCIVMAFPATSADKVGDVWDKFIKDYKGKTKYDRKMKEYFTDNATIKGMSDNTVDVYAKVEDRGEAGSEIAIWYNLGVTYLSKKDFPTQFAVAEEMLNKFTKRLNAALLEELLKAEEKALKGMEGDLKDLVKEEEKRKKDIEDYKETIKKMEESIKKAEEDVKAKLEEQGGKKKEIDDQTKKITELKQKISTMK